MIKSHVTLRAVIIFEIADESSQGLWRICMKMGFVFYQIKIVSLIELLKKKPISQIAQIWQHRTNKKQDNVFLAERLM